MADQMVDYSTVRTVYLNGSQIKKIIFNGTRVWEQIETPVYNTYWQSSGYWYSYYQYVSSGYYTLVPTTAYNGYWTTVSTTNYYWGTCVGVQTIPQYGVTFYAMAGNIYQSWGVVGYTTQSYTYSCLQSNTVSSLVWVSVPYTYLALTWVDTSYYVYKTDWVDTSGYVTQTTYNISYYP